MLLTLRAVLLALFSLSVSVCAEAQTRTLAVYAGSAEHLDAGAELSMRLELQRLLGPAGLNVIWKNIAQRRAGEDFEFVAVASFEGSCSAAPQLVTPIAASLADTSISNGRILPFFRVDCARITQMLGAGVESTVLGRALGRVIAHEIYHIVAQSAEHHDRGVAKAVFSARDLSNPRFEFDPWTLARLRPPPTARAEENEVTTGR